MQLDCPKKVRVGAEPWRVRKRCLDAWPLVPRTEWWGRQRVDVADRDLWPRWMTAFRGQGGGLVSPPRTGGRRGGSGMLKCLLSLQTFGDASLRVKRDGKLEAPNILTLTSFLFLLLWWCLHFHISSLFSVAPWPMPCCRFALLPGSRGWLWSHQGFIWDSHCALFFPTSHVPQSKARGLWRESELSYTHQRDFWGPLNWGCVHGSKDIRIIVRPPGLESTSAPLTSCVALNRYLNFSEFQFLDL